MKDHARERIELAVPRRAFERRLGMSVARIPAPLDAGRAEIDVLGVGLAIVFRRLQAHHMHSRLTTIARQFADKRLVEFGVGQPCSKLVDDMTQAMNLLLPCDLGRDPAGILHVLLPVEHFAHGSRLGAKRIPEVNGEDQRVLARVVVEHRFGRRVRQHAAVPVELAFDPHRRKGRRQRARCQDVLDRKCATEAVEIAHLAGPHMGGTNREPRAAAIDQIEIDELKKCLLQRRNRIIAGMIRTERIGIADMGQRIGLEEAGNPLRDRRPDREPFVEAGKGIADMPNRRLLHSLPKFLQPREPLSGFIAGNQARIDGADRGADDPIGLDALLMQRLIDPGLIGAERAATLQHQHDLAGKRLAEVPDALRLTIVLHAVPSCLDAP